MKKKLQLVVISVVLVASLGGTLCHAQRRPDQAVTYRSFDYVRSVTASMTYVYFATTGGILRYNKLQQSWELPLTGTEGMPTEPIEAIWVDRFDRTLVIRTDIGLYEYDDFFQRWYPISELPAMDSDIKHLSAPGVLLPEFEANYLGNGEFADFNGRTFITTDIIDDGTGTLWIGTWGMGPAMADASAYLMSLLPYGLMQDRVDFILAEDSTLWLGGRILGDFRTGLTALNTQNNSFLKVESGLFTGLPAVDIYSLESDSTHLYVGTEVGLYILDRTNWSTTGPLTYRHGLPDDYVLALERVNRALYVGTASGLCRIDLESDSVFHIHTETFRRHVIYDLERVENTLWIGSSAGAFRYTYDTDRLQQFQDRDMVITGSVLNVEYHSGNVWFATDAGAVRLELATGISESFDEPDSEPDHRALAINDWIIALSSNRGLTFIFWNEEKTRTRRFLTDDGLASDMVLTLHFDGDYLWVGSDEGLTRFLWNNPIWID